MSTDNIAQDSGRRRILRAIKRTAEANGGIPLGAGRFEAETGIKQSEWRGRWWARWSDALTEAGYEPNQPKQAFGDEDLLQSMIALVRRLGRLPTWAEWSMEHRRDPAFPSVSAFRRAGIGTSSGLAAKLAEYCQERDGLDDVLRAVAASRSVPGDSPRSVLGDSPTSVARDGSVYLIHSGRHYKIGRAYAVGRRARDIALQLPERAVTVHVIETDDPVGIEAYWHRRFESKRKGGEWFELDAADVRAFKRRKRFM